MKKVKSIIWDWNGTLLNDVDICINSINHLLSKRGHTALTREKYREIFTFPVKEYYESAGFNFQDESFDEVAVEFIDLYRDAIRECTLFPDAMPVLEWFGRKGYRQYMVSAMEHQFLEDSLQNCKVAQYFHDFSGIDDHLANGKVAMARKFIANRGIDPMTTIFIGDTLHDSEVAKTLGMRCLLVASGHQSEARLLSSGSEVVPGLKSIVKLFN